MKVATSFSLNVVTAVLIVIVSATMAAAVAGTDTCVGANATIGGTCTPLTNTTSVSNDNTTLGFNALLFNTSGSANTAAGVNALEDNTTGIANTATGAGALTHNISGGNDTATGVDALFANTTGANNTATGQNALLANTVGSDNTATGVNALGGNTAGFGNTASGEASLQDNTMGGSNTASGAFALQDNTTGSSNTAAGDGALNSNTTASGNTAAGASAVQNNTTGDQNTAIGLTALVNNTTGQQNTATGTSALQNNTTGSNNIGIGTSAGLSLTTGDNNIDIFNPGIAGEANTIRIGTQGTQTTTFIAGIFGGPRIRKGCDVVADNSGMLGCTKSSARYKRDIRDMGDTSDRLMKLRPVTFQYKEDSDGVRQYGLIAEEVEKVYPELVIDDKDGKAETVEYQVLPAMLLNEVQKEYRDSERKSVEIAKLSAQIAEMKASMRRERLAFEERLSRIEQTVASRDGGHNLAAAFGR